MNKCAYGGKYAAFHSGAESEYKIAIEYYKKQKENFKNWIRQQSGVAAAESIEALTESINNILKSDMIAEITTHNSVEHFKAFEQKLVDYLSISDSSNIMQAQIQNALKVLYSQDDSHKIADIQGKEIVAKIRTLLDQIITGEEIKNKLNEIFKQEFRKNLEELTQNELNMIYSFTRRIIYNQFKGDGFQMASTTGRQLSGYVNAFAGYGKEDILILLLNQYLKNNQISGIAKLTGEEKNINNQEINVDILIGNKRSSKTQSTQLANQLDRYLMTPLSKKLKNLSNNADARLQINLFDPDHFIGAGLQSKSWPMPSFVEEHNRLNKKQLRPYYSIGKRQSFRALASVASGDKFDVFSWHYNIYALSRNVIPLLGAANILYSTGSGVLWTYELIQEFRHYNYYLSFYFKHSKGVWQRPATSEVTWQQEVEPSSFKGFKQNLDNSKKF